MSTPPFDFHCVPRIVFGRGQFARLAELCAPLGKSVLIVTNAGPPGRSEPTGRAAELLGKAGLRWGVFHVSGEPEVQDVDRALAQARQEAHDVLVALGGGSAIDLAKAVAGLLGSGGCCLDYMEVIGAGRKIARASAPWVAVPTTAGTGAEVTRNAVIACRDKQFKASIRSEHLLARVAVVDPELGSSVPREVTACSGMDALCQLIESYTSTGANPMTDALALAGVERAGRSLRRAYQDGADMDAREDMALAALWSGLALANAGLGAVHGFAAPLGARFQAPHGAICAILLPHVMAANVSALRAAGPDHPTLRRYADIGKRLAGEPANDDPAAIESGIRIVHDLVGDLNIPRLGRFGVTEADLPDLASAARRSSSMKYNPVPLPEETLVGILRHAL